MTFYIIDLDIENKILIIFCKYIINMNSSDLSNSVDSVDSQESNIKNNNIGKKTYNYVIYHKNCTDGFSGFFILTTTGLIAKDAMIFPDRPNANDVPHNIDGKDVIIIDVAYKINILDKIFKRARSVLYIDHHVTVVKDVLDIKLRNNDFIVYDVNESGASLVWKHFYPNEKIPKFVTYIKDNDIGAWKHKFTIPFVAGLEVHYKLEPTEENIKKWHDLFNIKEVARIIKNGLIYNDYKEYLIDSHYRRYSLEKFPSEKIYNDYPNSFKKPGQYTVAVYNGNGCPDSSLLGKKIVNNVKCDFCILWTHHLDRKEYILSFRSKDADVGIVAKIFGGGGHKLASACSINALKYGISDLFFPDSLPRYTK
jgi:hypothetical protein